MQREEAPIWNKNNVKKYMGGKNKCERMVPSEHKSTQAWPVILAQTSTFMVLPPAICV